MIFMAHSRISFATASLLLLALGRVVRGELSLGNFHDTKKNVSGEVVVISEHALEVRNFTYDGTAPDVFFWADVNANPTKDGFSLIQASKNCSTGNVQYADGTETIRLEFPVGSSIANISGGSIAVWCRTMFVSAGQVEVPVDGLDGSLFVKNDQSLLICTDNVVDKGFFGNFYEQLKTFWNVLRWLPTKLF